MQLDYWIVITGVVMVRIEHIQRPTWQQITSFVGVWECGSCTHTRVCVCMCVCAQLVYCSSVIIYDLYIKKWEVCFKRDMEVFQVTVPHASMPAEYLHITLKTNLPLFNIQIIEV